MTNLSASWSRSDKCWEDAHEECVDEQCNCACHHPYVWPGEKPGMYERYRDFFLFMIFLSGAFLVWGAAVLWILKW